MTYNYYTQFSYTSKCVWRELGDMFERAGKRRGIGEEEEEEEEEEREEEEK